MTGADLPSGTVTLLFTDVEGSTRLWELHGPRMLDLLARHDELVQAAVESHGGVLQRSRAEGDSSFAVFSSANAAVAAAIDLQRSMAIHPWPADIPIRTRAALHTGEIEHRGGTYYGPVVNRCVRLRSLAHGAQTILSGATADAAVALPAGAWLVDLGTHRLKDLALPEQVHELHHPDLAAEFPPLRSPDVERHNLPRRRDRFVGRSQDRRDLAKALQRERLLTLTGPGGVGKTRLALELAWAHVEEDRDDDGGTWFVDLTTARTGDDALAAVAAAIGVREQPGRSVEDTLVDALAEDEHLVVIDNAEHVLDEARSIARTLLGRSPGVRILATSRESLGLAEERRILLGGLPLDDAVALFAARAGSASDAVDPDAAERLCDRLQGIPLAVEVAAARVEALGAAVVDAGIAEALAVDAGRTILEATLSWSHDLLDDAERAAHRRLGVFAGTFPLDAAEAVIPGGDVDAGDVLDLVVSLVEHSLVYVADGGGYRQLAVVRDHARRLAATAGEWPALEAAHLRWMLMLVDTSRVRPDARARLDPLRLALDDLLAALDRTFEEDDTLAAQQVRLAGALEELFLRQGLPAEGRARLEAVLARGRGFRSHRAEVHRSLGSLAERHGDLAASDHHLGAANALFEEIVDELRASGSEHLATFEYHLAQTRIARSELARLRGDAEQSLELARRALETAPPGSAVVPAALLAIGMAEHALDRSEEGERAILDAVDLLRDANADAVLADCLRSLGGIARLRDDRTAADAHFREALRLAEAAHDRVGVARAMVGLADLAVLRGAADASARVEEALDLARDVGDRRAEADAVELAGLVAFAAGDAPAAQTRFEAAAVARQSIGLAADAALGRINLARARAAAGDLRRALDDATVAVAAYESVADRRGRASARAHLAEIAALSGQAALAADEIRKAVGDLGEADAPTVRDEIRRVEARLRGLGIEL